MSYYTGFAPYAPYGNVLLPCFFEASAADMYDDDKLIEVTFDFTNFTDQRHAGSGIEVHSIRVGDIRGEQIEELLETEEH